MFDNQTDDLATVVNYWPTSANLHKKYKWIENDDETKLKTLKYVFYQVAKVAGKHIMIPLERRIL
jgi:hypothetical protein